MEGGKKSKIMLFILILSKKKNEKGGGSLSLMLRVFVNDRDKEKVQELFVVILVICGVKKIDCGGFNFFLIFQFENSFFQVICYFFCFFLNEDVLGRSLLLLWLFEKFLY